MDVAIAAHLGERKCRLFHVHGKLLLHTRRWLHLIIRTPCCPERLGARTARPPTDKEGGYKPKIRTALAPSICFLSAALIGSFVTCDVSASMKGSSVPKRSCWGPTVLSA